MSDSGDSRAHLTLAASAACGMIAQQVGGKVVRDALFLSSFPATDLPQVVVASAIVSMLAVLATARLMATRGPAFLVPAAFLTNAVVFGVEWGLAPIEPKVTAVLIYLHTAAVGGVVISGFWSVVNERFDPHTARHNIARITTGATLGGLLGGLGAERLAALVEPRSILLMLAALNFLCAIGVRRLASSLETAKKVAPRITDGMQPLVKSAYLRNVAFVVVAVAISEVFLEYVMKAEAAEVYTEGASLVSFFAVFYTGAAFLTFVVQLFLTKQSLERLGLGGTLSIGPAMVAVGAIVVALVPSIWSIAIVTGLQAVAANSMFRSAYELLYTPVAPTEKRPIKVVIDVALARFATMLGSGVILVLVATVAGVNTFVVVGASGVAGIALWLCLGLHRRYVDELGHSLETGVVELAEDDIVDATTRKTLASTTMALDRDRLLQEIAELRGSGSGAAEAVDAAVRKVADETSGDTGDYVEKVRTLKTGNAEAIRKLLETDPFDPALVAFVVPLLGRTDGARAAAASTALEKNIDRISGQLTDIFLDTETPLLIRRRLPRVLKKTADDRVVSALLRALSDEDFDVRYWSGRALGRIVDDGGAVDVDEAKLLTIVDRALGVPDEAWKRHRRIHGDPSPRKDVNRALEHVFTMLSLVFDREVVKLTYGALRGDDTRLHGTALEYLENVVPAHIARAIERRLEQPTGRTGPARPATEVAKELRESAVSIRFEPADLEST